MSDSKMTSRRRRSASWTLLGLILLAAALYFLTRCADQDRPLKPIRPTVTAVSASVQGQPVSIRFPELNEAPETLLNRRIRVSGAYTGLSASPCPAPKGPNSRWALIADDLQLDAVGFEQLLRLVAPGTQITVEGFWRSYHGPVGCGKNLEQRTVWYLEVDQIIEPNPLLAGGITPEPQTQEAGPTSSPDQIDTATPAPTLPGADSGLTVTPATGEATPTLTPTVTQTPTPTATTDPAAEATATLVVTGSATTTAGSVTATATSGATPSGTGTTTPTATATSPVATSQSTQTPLPTSPPIATATPGGYPGPNTTPASGSTSTPTGYP